MSVKIFVDDTRDAPEGWTLVKSAKSALELLKAGAIIDELSLDHDLGGNITGYDLLEWIEEQVYTNNEFLLPVITIHSQNPVGVAKMQQALRSIYRKVQERLDKDYVVKE